MNSWEHRQGYEEHEKDIKQLDETLSEDFEIGDARVRSLHLFFLLLEKQFMVPVKSLQERNKKWTLNKSIHTWTIF